MPEMDVRWRFGLVLAILVTGCIPTPASRGRQPVGNASGAPTQTDSSAASSAASPVGPSLAPSFERPTPNPSPTFLVYEVRAGDSLTSIARLFGTTARSIAYWNRDRYPSLDPDSADYEPNRIEAGWTLRIIPTEVVDEDELPDSAPTPTSLAASGSPT